MKNLYIYEQSNGKRPYSEWLNSLDKGVRQRIEQRMLRVILGNYGSYSVLKNAENIIELRFTFGSGYRVYIQEEGNEIIILLAGGDKNSQETDIKKAQEYWRDYLNRKDENEH